MKNVILIAIYMTIAALTFGIVMSLHGREAREAELISNLSSVSEETVENGMLANNYEIEESRLFLADFIENLAAGLETESDLTLKIIKADAKEGILSVEAEEHYEHLNGNSGSVKCIKTVIFNRLINQPALNYQVRFYLTEEDMRERQNCYKVYSVAGGDLITAPAEPLQEGACFNGWMDMNGYLADFTEAVTEERLYYADWRSY